MACCGKKIDRHNPFDRLGNKKKSSLSKYAFLNPNQIVLRDAQEESEDNEEEDK